MVRQSLQRHTFCLCHRDRPFVLYMYKVNIDNTSTVFIKDTSIVEYILIEGQPVTSSTIFKMCLYLDVKLILYDTNPGIVTRYHIYFVM